VTAASGIGRAEGEQTPAPAGRIILHEAESDLVVRSCEPVADRVIALSLVHPDGEELPGWTPGAHIDLILNESLTRQYSLCSSPTDPNVWRIGVLLDPDSRGGSQFIHDELEPGSVVRVRGPRNHFPLVDAPRYQFIAGGIGITPILPMIESVVANGAEWELLYGGRRRESMAFVDELAAYGGRVRICPRDEQGRMDLDATLGSPRDDTLVYCCGPESLLGAVEGFCSSWPEGIIHVERFAARLVDAAPAPGARESFEVVCQRSGVTVKVPAGKSVYEVVDEAGIQVLASCLEGLCGTCEAAVIEGTPDHRDSVLTDAEKEAGEFMMICVSRACSERLVLDL
jgi:ferredoxin-NADP reductase